jgi:hypothetical protein
LLRTNSKISPLQVMLRYRDPQRVEQLLRQANAILATRPIYHRGTWPFAAMFSALFSRSCSPRNSKIGSTDTAPNGATCCAISTGYRRSSSSRTARAQMG